MNVLRAAGTCCALLFTLLLIAIPVRAATAPTAEQAPALRAFLSGYIVDGHNEPVKDAEIRVWVDGRQVELFSHGQPAARPRSQGDGTFLFDLHLSRPLAAATPVRIRIGKSSFKTVNLSCTGADFAHKGNELFLEKSVMLPRTLGPAFWIATLILLGVYVLITLELIHRTVVAMLGAAAILAVSSILGSIDPAYHIISFEAAVQKIDLNVIFLLLGMMVIVGVLKKSGLFQWSAARCYKLARGNIMLLSVMLMVLTAVASGFLDNVTTMLLIAPVTIEIAVALRITPIAFLIPEILAANVGGAATLIGDPPNIMIGSFAGLTFLAFLKNLALICAVTMIPLIIMSKLHYGKIYKLAEVEDPEAFAKSLQEDYRITDKSLLVVGLTILAVVIGLFVSHGYWHMEVSVAALTGASILFTYALLTRRVDLQSFMEKEIDWGSLLFFVFLFMIIGSVEESGLLSLIADGIFKLSQGHMVAAICVILWGSALMSAFIDNIPFTATMLPVTAYLSQVIPGAQNHVLWWALALGACLGGNGTMIGASANVVTIGIAEARGYHTSFVDFLKVGFVYMVISVAIANVWLLTFY